MYYKEDNIYYVVFPSTRVFLKALPLVEENGITHRVVPMPDHISSECGMTLEVKGQELLKTIALLDENNIIHEIKE